MSPGIILKYVCSFFFVVFPLALSLRGDSFQTIPQVAGGYQHSLALRSDGTVWTWGIGNAGQLGHPEGRTGRIVPAPIKGFNLIFHN